jgi:branched-subunit amino acid aminotransferase/4-amino-4-deoxychorismate lyase
VTQYEQLGDATFNAFFEAVRQAQPKNGDWFPRIEFRQHSSLGDRLFLRIRPAPERTMFTSLWTYPEPDPRENPLVKGPDLSLCQQLRRKANLHGADEAVLLDAEGFIADGALSSILWWRGDTLCGPDDATNWLDSITRQELFDLADQAGYKTVVEKCRPADLHDLEIWSASSLQGVRGVQSWNGIEVGKSVKLKSFRKRLQLLSSAL